MRLLICGSRDWSNRDILWRALDLELEQYADPADLTIVEGEARGADTMARQWALLHGVPVERHPARWDEDGRGAGFKRNAEMVASGVGAVFAFSTALPVTRGTAHTCRLAYDAGLVVVVFTPDGQSRKYVK